MFRLFRKFWQKTMSTRSPGIVPPPALQLSDDELETITGGLNNEEQIRNLIREYREIDISDTFEQNRPPIVIDDRPKGVELS